MSDAGDKTKDLVYVRQELYDPWNHTSSLLYDSKAALIHSLAMMQFLHPHKTYTHKILLAPLVPLSVSL